MQEEVFDKNNVKLTLLIMVVQRISGYTQGYDIVLPSLTVSVFSH
jgi:galactitol-specific phosphotransferase system IIB component